MFCIECGSKMPDDARFCLTCGAGQPPDGGVDAQRSVATGTVPTEPIRAWQVARRRLTSAALAVTAVGVVVLAVAAFIVTRALRAPATETTALAAEPPTGSPEAVLTAPPSTDASGPAAAATPGRHDTKRATPPMPAGYKRCAGHVLLAVGSRPYFERDTTCGFARNVYRTYQDEPKASLALVKSPKTGEWYYDMACTQAGPWMHCRGGTTTDAHVRWPVAA